MPLFLPKAHGLVIKILAYVGDDVFHVLSQQRCTRDSLFGRLVSSGLHKGYMFESNARSMQRIMN